MAKLNFQHNCSFKYADLIKKTKNVSYIIIFPALKMVVLLNILRKINLFLFFFIFFKLSLVQFWECLQIIQTMLP